MPGRGNSMVKGPRAGKVSAVFEKLRREEGRELFLQRKLRRAGESRWVYRALRACVEVGSKKIKTGCRTPGLAVCVRKLR